MTFPLGALYHSTKFAVEGLSEALQYELGPLGVRVKIVEPGGIMTDFGGRSMDSTNDPNLPEYQALVRNVAHRRSADDATFFAGLREQFGLSR